NTIKRRMTSGDNPRDIKLELAYEIVKMYHSSEDANRSREKWLSTVSGDNIADDIPLINVTSNKLSLVNLATTLDPTMSNSQARRLIEAGGMRLDGKKVTVDEPTSLKNGSIIQL